MSVSFNGCNEQIVTFKAESGLEAGMPVKLSDNNTVSACSSGDSFFGVCTDVRNGYASIQISGFARLGYTGTTEPDVGYCTLAGDGDGGVEVVASGGRDYLAVNIDTIDSVIEIML